MKLLLIIDNLDDAIGRNSAIKFCSVNKYRNFKISVLVAARDSENLEKKI